MSYRRTVIASFLLLLWFLLQTGHSAVPAAPEYDLAVSFDIPRAKIIGLSRIPVTRGRPLALRVSRLNIRSVRVNQEPLDFQVRDGRLRVTPKQSGTLEINYEGVFARVAGTSFSRDADIPNVIGREGIFLASAWYPQIDALAHYRLQAVLPRGYAAVSEAEKIDRVDGSDGVKFIFQFEHPLDRVSLVASDRYQITEHHFHGVELSAYFFPEDQTLAAQYVDYAEKYIELYEKLLLPFPFKRFAIVENFLPTGYSMPTYTLLGQEVVRLPFIVETSLGHEILHQWFGNELYIDDRHGNWAEGLTTYLADHWYQEQKGEGWKYRKQILIDYANYVNDRNEFPLSRFTQRFDAASRSIGYGKTAMVFHMLRQTLGDEAFFDGLRSLLRQKKFQRVSWDDFRALFHQQTGKELAPFFNQWLERKGLVKLRLSQLSAAPAGSAFVLSFDLAQAGQIYNLDVPVKIVYKSGGEKSTRVAIGEKTERVQIELEKQPAKVIIDENMDIARRLSAAEIPPVIGSLLGAERLTIVLPLRDEPKYEEIIKSFRARVGAVTVVQSLEDSKAGASPLLILGKDNPLVRRLYPDLEMPDKGFNLTVKKNPLNPLETVGIVSSASAAETKAAFPKVSHYGKYSALKFENGRNVIATVEESERGIQEIVKVDPPALELSSLKKLSDVVKGLANKKIVYVGEQHDNFAHHQVQLEVLEGLYKQGPKVAVGMEMFQRPFQKALDDYIAGAIDERTFLKRSEYFKRWDIDYHLYKPILDFARAKHLPVVALNVRREIVEKVGKSGLDSLSKEEKQEIPAALDRSDSEYRNRLKEAFAAHQEHGEKRDFEFFYEAQLLWDETMAESIDRFLKQNPDYRMVVLAGAGHVQYGSGIPKRAFKRNGLSYAIVLSDAEIEKNIADYIVFPEPAKATMAPKLMVMIEDRDQTVRIKGFAKDSVSEKAGLKLEDTILALDDHPVNSIEDIKIALFFKNPGDSIMVKAGRMNASKQTEAQQIKVTLE
jgi:aminopeptidase N